MNEFAEAIKILKDLGVIQIFSIPLAFLVFAFLFKKIILNGAGQTLNLIAGFLKTIILELVESEKERIKLETSIKNTLNEIAEGLKELRRLIEANKEVTL
jgi:hypothetical protein